MTTIADDSGSGAARIDSDADLETDGHHSRDPFLKLAVGAVGVVFGDIGTSPIYAFRETFASHHGAPGIQVDQVHIHGVLSLVFWSMMMVVTFKYAMILLREIGRASCRERV